MQLCSAGSVRRYILCLSGSGLESLETPLADGSLGSLPSETGEDKVSLGVLPTYISSPGETHSVGLVLRRSSLGCVLGVTLPLLLSFGTLLSRQVQKVNELSAISPHRDRTSTLTLPIVQDRSDQVYRV